MESSVALSFPSAPSVPLAAFAGTSHSNRVTEQYSSFAEYLTHIMSIKPEGHLVCICDGGTLSLERSGPKVKATTGLFNLTGKLCTRVCPSGSTISEAAAEFADRHSEWQEED